jgi:uncharacterized protein YehS (DUF1456 family)
MVAIFKSVEIEVDEATVIAWLSKDNEPIFEEMPDQMLNHFLNGFIIDKRGKQEGVKPIVEKDLNNNIIFRKLKIALNLKDTDIVELMALVNMRISKHEITAFFRKPEQKQYRRCGDQFLRNFIFGIQKKYRKS